MKKFFEALKEGLKYLLDVLIPKDKDEKIVFVSVFLFLVAVSIFLYMNDSAIFREWGMMGFDVGYYYIKISSIGFMTPFTDVVHPLFSGIMLPVSIFNRLCIIFFDQNPTYGWRLIGAIEFNFISTCCIVIIYKYCHSLLGLTKQISLTIIIFFLMHAHVMLLSFVPESYSLSMLFLLILVYITTDNILNGKKIPFSSNVILFCLVTGMTISNGLKVVYAVLFQRGTFKERVKIIFHSGLICLSIIIVSFVVTYFFVMFMNNYVTQLIREESRDVLGRTVVVWITTFDIHRVASLFFSECILFHQNVGANYDIAVENLQFAYNSIFPIIVLIVYYGLILFTIFLYRKEKAVMFLLSLFSVDVLIHLVCCYGLMEAQIFSLHWIFILPLLVGWLYRKVVNTKWIIPLNVVILFLIISFACNNIPRFLEITK